MASRREYPTGRAALLLSASCTVAMMCRINGSEKHNAFGPEDFAEIVQKAAVGVDLLRALEYLQVAEHVPDHECKENRAGHRHDDLLAGSRIPEGCGAALAEADRGCTHSIPPTFKR